MKKKREEELRRRLESLPKHHIDGSIILESSRTEDGRYCRRYLNKVGYNYKGIFSLPVIGELFIHILSLDKEQDIYEAIEFIKNLIKAKKIEFYVPKNIAPISAGIADKRIGTTDKDIFACSVEDNAINLVTLDKDMIGSKELEKFGVKVKHPKELV